MSSAVHGSAKCPKCGITFPKKTKSQTYCSPQCSLAVKKRKMWGYSQR